MASNSTKSFLADAGYGEQELDANSALMELDKGRGRSGRSVGAGMWRHPVAAAGEARRTHAPLRGAESAAATPGASAAAPAGLLDWPGTAVPRARASEDAFDHLGAQSAYFPNSQRDHFYQ